MIHRVTGHLEEKSGSKYLVLSSDIELMEKYRQNFGMGLKTRLNQLMVVKNLNMVKILWGSNSTQMMICR